MKIDETYIQGKELRDKRKSLVDLIKKPRKLNTFFTWLNDRFNGVLFKDIKFELSKEQAKDLADIFKGEKVEKDNLFYGIEPYFEIFDFSIIPVELISGIYESLITKATQKLNSAVYTPLFLVEYVLKNTVDDFFQKNSNRSEVKIFDPAVGSGIFLVQGFRRMVDREIELTQNDTVKKSRLKEIIEQNIYGIDVNPQALNVTCFSLYIAILDYQTPSTIIDNFHFPNLIGENLFERSFFKKDSLFDKLLKEKNIDFILGNPPWQNNKDKEHLDWLKNKNLLDIISDYQIAQSYTLRTEEFSSKNTKCCFIITSKAVYNNNAGGYRTYFLEKFFLTKCFDLSPVRHLIFKGADSPAMIINFHFADDAKTENNIVEHQSLKHNIFIKYFKTLIIEKFDVKSIKQKHFIENSWMFKVALYGGVLDFQLLKKFAVGKKLQNVFNENNIPFSKGIFKGTPTKQWDFLIGLPIIKRKEIENYYTPIKNTFEVLNKNTTFLEAGRDKELFKGKKILVQKSTTNRIKFSSINFDVAFDSTVYGVNFNSDKNNLFEIFYALLESNFYTYFQFLTSAGWGIYIPEIYKREHLNFPFIEPTKNEQNRLVSIVNNFIETYQELYNQPNLGNIQGDEYGLNLINPIIEEIYDINTYEKDLINYVLDVSRYQFQESKIQKVIRKVHDDQNVLERYIDVFIDQFKGLYKNEYLKVEVYALDYFIGMNFVFTKEKPKQTIIFNQTETDEQKILKILSENLTISKVSEKIFVQKDIKGFEENSFYIIKPNEYKCWHRAMAWYDVAEIKKTIEDAEIDYLKNGFND